VRAKRVGKKHRQVGRQQKRSPKQGRSNGKQITYVPGLRVFVWPELAIRERPGLREVEVGVAPVFLKPQIVLN